MNYEIELYRRSRPASPDLATEIPSTPQLRKEMREASDSLIFYALHRQSVAAVGTHCAGLMLQMARTLDSRGESPTVSDLINGASTLIQDVRDRIDKALLLQDSEQLRWAATMMELVTRGILGVLLGNVPYPSLMEVIAEHGDLHGLLVACNALPPTPPNTGVTS